MSLFIIFIVVLATILMTRQIDLVSEDYYQNEINYQEEIDQINNLKALRLQPRVEITAKELIVQFPDQLEITNAEIHLLRPDNNQLDLKFPIEGTLFFAIPLEKLVQGKYKYKLIFEANKKKYLKEGEIYF
jgi:hypothetical protein